MTVITQQPTTIIPEPFAGVTLDLYRDIHKGIRALLFDASLSAGRVDPEDRIAKGALVAQLGDLAQVLVSHAEHEDAAIQPVVDEALPALAAQIAEEHHRIEARIGGLDLLAVEALETSGPAARLASHRLAIEVASFTAAYLEHQDLEERAVMPALEEAIGVAAVVEVHQAILGAIPPDELANSLVFMLPAMNVLDRVELLGGMQAGAPAEVFAAVWDVAGQVLTPGDRVELGRRLGVS